MVIDYDLMAKLAKEYDYQYQIEEIYGNLIANRLDKDFDIYVAFNESYKEFTCEALGLKISMLCIKFLRKNFLQTLMIFI